MTAKCPFCSKSARVAIEAERRPWDCILFESPNFIVFPSMGAIVEGWLLIAPREHYLCMASLDGSLWEELNLLREFVSLALRDCFGSLVLFEHGPARASQAVGCGVDHAHFHIVPTDCDLIDSLRSVFPDPLEWKLARGVQDAATLHMGRAPYLYVEQPLGRGFLTSHPKLGSQLFRKVVAAHVGRHRFYDWRRFPEEENVRSTVQKIQAWKRGHRWQFASKSATDKELQ